MNIVTSGSMTSLFALSLALGVNASAQAEDAPRVEDTIIVTSSAALAKAEEYVARTAGGADVVSHEDYADRSLVSLRDTLAYSPGVYVQPRFGQEIRISIRGSGLSRGFHMRGLTLLQDGIPINLADDNGDFQELEPIFFDHLEVYRGSNALRFGSGTLGGAINGVTPTGETAPGLYVRADAGSFDTVRGLVSYGASRDGIDYWAAVSADTSKGDRDHAERGSLRFHGNLGIDLSQNAKTRFYVSVNDINQELPGALTLDDAENAPETGNFTGDQARDIESIRLQNRTTFLTENGEINVGAFLNVKSLYHPIFQVIDQENTDYGVFARQEWEKGDFAFTLGGEVRIGETASRRFINLNGDPGALAFDADQDARTSSLYGEFRYSPADNLTLIAGGVYANGEREQHQTFNLFQGGPTNFTGDVDFSEFSPKFGVLYEPSDSIQLYANYSRSAEFPGFIELAQVATFVDLEPQTAWTAEIGTRGQLGVAEWDISIYRSEVEDELLQFTVGDDVPASTFNADDTIHQGIEAGLSLDLHKYLRLRQVYQYSDFSFDGDAQYGDNDLPVVPEHVYRAELRIGGEKFNISPNLEWVPTGAYADYNNTRELPDYVLLGMTASYSVTDSIDLFLDARNLTDETGAGDVSAVITAADDSRIYYPLERRAVFGGVRARF